MAGYDVWQNQNNWIDKRYKAPSGGDWTNESIGANRDMYNELRNWRSGASNQVTSYGNLSSLPGDKRYKGNENDVNKFNKLGYTDQNVNDWRDNFRGQWDSKYNDIINKYTYNEGNTGSDGLKTPVPGNPNDGLLTPPQPETGFQVNDDVYKWLLSNPERPADAVLQGLLTEGQNLQTNNQTYIDKEKDRTDEILAMLQNNNTPKTTQSYNDILSNTMDSNNPLLKLSKTRANEEMSRRGLLTSTLGIEAAEKAYLEQAQELANSEMSGQQYNTGEENKLQSQLMGELGSTGRQSLDFMDSIYNNDQTFNQDMMGDKQKFGFDLINQREQAKIDTAALQDKFAKDMERLNFEFTSELGTEMAKQQSGLFAQYTAAYATIGSSTIPQSAKDAHLIALGDEIDRAVKSLNQYSKFKIAKNADNTYSFNTVYNPESRLQAQPETASTPQAQAQKDEEHLNQKVNEIYEQVRVGGGDTPEESLIDAWRYSMAWAKQASPNAYTQAMNIYSEHGLTNSNWEDILAQMNGIIQPAKLAAEEAAQAKFSHFYQ